MCPLGYHHNGFLATHYIVTLFAFYMNVTKYKLNDKKLSRPKVCMRVCVYVCMRVCSFIFHKI